MSRKPSYEELERRIQELEQMESNRTRSEEQLIHSHDLMDYIISHARSSIAVHDRDLRYVYVSKRYLKEYKVEEENVIGKHHYDVFPDLPQKWRDVHQRSLAGEVLSAEEDPYYREDGSVDWTRWECRPWYEADGAIGGIVIYTEVINERKRAEEALREGELKLRTILESAQDGIFTINFNTGERHYANQAMADMLDYSTEELLRERFQDSVDPDTAATFSDIGREMISSKEAVHGIEYEMTRKDGSNITVSSTLAPLIDSEGRITEVVGIMRDITESKQAQKEMADSMERLRAVFENASDGILLADVETREFRACNKRLGRMLGYDRKRILSMKVPDIHPKEDLPHVIDMFESQARGEITLAEDVPCLRKDGTVFYADINTTSYKIEDRAYNLGFFRDVTARREAAEERERLENDLRQAQKMEALGTLSGGIAHDFNNILGIIMGNTELAIDDIPDWNPAKECLNEIRTASLRAKGMVRQILSFSRHTLFEKKPIRLSPVIEETLTLMRATIPTSIDIREDLSAQDDVIVADQAQMSQVLMNLCTNAYQAMGDSGALRISLDDITIDAATVPGLASGSYIRLSVGDTGQGINPENIDKIFDPYFTTKKVGEGTGMGLAVIRGILTNHGGAITVDSKLGEGTTFHVYLPLADEDVAQKIDMPESLPFGTERILFVDDEEGIVRAYSRAISDLGYDVIPLTSSREALEAFKKEPGKIDLVITDMTMPEITGDKLAKELQKIRSDIPIIICTGHSERIAEETVKELGIAGYALKPIVKRDIALTIRRVLDSQG